jgi:hypothetical protein
VFWMDHQVKGERLVLYQPHDWEGGKSGGWGSFSRTFKLSLSRRVWNIQSVHSVSTEDGILHHGSQYLSLYQVKVARVLSEEGEESQSVYVVSCPHYVPWSETAERERERERDSSQVREEHVKVHTVLFCSNEVIHTILTNADLSGSASLRFDASRTDVALANLVDVTLVAACIVGIARQ